MFCCDLNPISGGRTLVFRDRSTHKGQVHLKNGDGIRPLLFLPLLPTPAASLFPALIRSPPLSYLTTAHLLSRNFDARSETSDTRRNSISEGEFKLPEHLKRERKWFPGSDFFSRKQFREIGCAEYLVHSLRKQFFTRPSHIQAAAFDPVVKGKSCIIADQSGSGKTLAYLLPLIQRFQKEELQRSCKSSSKCPQVITVVPTAELAFQVLDACQSISKTGVLLQSMVATGGSHRLTQMKSSEKNIDVLVGTPGSIVFLIEKGNIQLNDLKCIVLDEADILFKDESLDKLIQKLISHAPAGTQYLFVTATLPVDIYKKMVNIFPDCEIISGPCIHRISHRLNEVVVDCSVSGSEITRDAIFLNKKSALLEIVEKKPVPKTIIFCNKIETCRKVENILRRYYNEGDSLHVLPFHAGLSTEIRSLNMKEFIHSQSAKKMMFLVCTDRASQGVDFSGVNQVILFDFPHDPSEYVRRVGRTARGANQRGKAFIFAAGRQVSVAHNLVRRNRKGHPVHDIPFLDLWV